MYSIRQYNTIAGKGLKLLNRKQYSISETEEQPDALLVRSAVIPKTDISSSVIAIARAGVGVNNIPVEYCTKQGIIVFNTPGANANSVKELVIAALLLSARKIFHGILWTQSLAGRRGEIAGLVEKHKQEFGGPELFGKTLGVIGLGAVGATIANAAVDLGMNVIGYDPYLSVQSAWKLNRLVVHVEQLEKILSSSDYISIHVPLTDNTKNLINADTLAKIKTGAHILNFSRAGLVVNKDVLEALQKKKIKGYITDFPEDTLLGREGILCIPHLGASTPEAEENCAVMAVRQLQQYLEHGNIDNSVNMDPCTLDVVRGYRLVILHQNIPNMVGQITAVLANEQINIADMLNKHRGSIACTIIDVESSLSTRITTALENIPGIIRLRCLKSR